MGKIVCKVKPVVHKGKKQEAKSNCGVKFAKIEVDDANGNQAEQTNKKMRVARVIYLRQIMSQACVDK
jgi:hypothetical protein